MRSIGGKNPIERVARTQHSLRRCHGSLVDAVVGNYTTYAAQDLSLMSHPESIILEAAFDPAKKEYLSEAYVAIIRRLREETTDAILRPEDPDEVLDPYSSTVAITPLDDDLNLSDATSAIETEHRGTNIVNFMGTEAPTRIEIARAVGLFRRNRGHRRVTITPDWSINRNPNNTAKKLIHNGWNDLLRRYAEYRDDIELNAVFTKAQLTGEFPEGNDTYPEGFSYLSDRGEYHPKLMIGDLGSGDNSHLLKLIHNSEGSARGHNLTHIYTGIGYTLHLFETIEKNFTNLLKDPKNNEHRSFIKFISETMLYKASLDAEFKAQIEGASTAEILEIMKTPKRFLKEKQATTVYKSTNPLQFSPWQVSETPGELEGRYFESSYADVESLFAEIFVENYADIIKEGRDGFAISYNCMIGDWMETVEPEVFDVAYSVRGLSQLPKRELPRYLQHILNGLTPNGIIISDDIHHDSHRYENNVYEWLDAVKGVSGSFVVRPFVITRGTKSDVPLAVYAQRSGHLDPFGFEAVVRSDHRVRPLEEIAINAPFAVFTALQRIKKIDPRFSDSQERRNHEIASKYKIARAKTSDLAEVQRVLEKMNSDNIPFSTAFTALSEDSTPDDELQRRLISELIDFIRTELG